MSGFKPDPLAMLSPGLERLAAEIRTECEAAEADWKLAVEHAIRAGELLTQAKGRAGHGNWLPWLKANFEFSQQTANDYMRLFANYGTSRNLPGSINAALKQLARPKHEPGNNMAVHFSSRTDEWATPQDFFDVVNAEFGFDLDVCALPSSAKCERYFTPEDDGLAQEWTGTCWMNPPYGDEIRHWVKKAHESAQAGATVVCLVPARTDTGWFQEYCFQGEVRFVRGRLRFGAAEAGAPFPSALVVFGPGVAPRSFVWDYARPAVHARHEPAEVITLPRAAVVEIPAAADDAGGWRPSAAVHDLPARRAQPGHCPTCRCVGDDRGDGRESEPGAEAISADELEYMRWADELVERHPDAA